MHNATFYAQQIEGDLTKRTTLDLPEDLLKEAMKAAHVKTKTKVIITALEDRLDLFINWNQIIGYQYKCLQNNCELFSQDNHFCLMKDILNLKRH